MSMSLPGRTAIITGAAGGIGRAVSTSLARRQVSLALADRNEVGLSETVAMCREFGVVAKGYALDVADATAIEAFPSRVLADFETVEILVNNAGVALRGRFEDVSLADMEWLFSINFWGAVRMTRAFLPTLRQADQAQLVNLSSLFGLIAPPGQAAYAASKFALRGFSEALRKELAGTSVGVTVVHPGGVATRIAADARRNGTVSTDQVAQENERFARLLRLAPEKAGEMIATAIERRTPRLLVGKDARLAALVERLMPVNYWRIIGRGAQ